MEFRINKIDTDLRQRINEERSEDKVHNKKGISINKDKNKEDKNNPPEQKKDEKKEKHDVPVNYEKESEIIDPDKGHFIDSRR